MSYELSIVIPSYQRIARPVLGNTLDALFASETDGLGQIEVVVVDDGSPVPVGALIEEKARVAPFPLRCIRQGNAGPGPARNSGFRGTTGRIVLFLDDDIVVPPGLLRQHVAAHAERPGSVVFGLTKHIHESMQIPLVRYLASVSLWLKAQDAAPTLAEATTLASGHLSVERASFPSGTGVYGESLHVPGSEEWEVLLARLRALRVPLFLATDIVALHDEPLTLEAVCSRQYKHGIGTAEAATKHAEVLAIPAVLNVIRTNGPLARGDTPRVALAKTVKRLLGVRPVRATALTLTKWLEAAFPRADRLLSPFYRAVIGVHFFAGVREGLRRPPAR